MFADIVKHMQVVELEPSELDQPISITTKGHVATVRDLIADKAPSNVRSMFAGTEVRQVDHVRPVCKLDPSALRIVATETLRKSDPKHRVAAIGLGEYTPQELIKEVERGSVMGARIVDAVRLSGLLVEQAIMSGKIKPKINFYENLRIPDFEF
jgi:hypothetical protein